MPGAHRRPRRGRWRITVLVLVLAAGAALISYGISRQQLQLPPAAAQFIPGSVGTDAPVAPSSAAVAVTDGSLPVRIQIPAISVSAPVEETSLDSSGAVSLPPLTDHNLAVWYDGSAVPGHKGTAVILGHVDGYTEKSAFFYLKELLKNDMVTVTLADGAREKFEVDGVQKVSKSAFPASVYAPASYPALRLVTCGGPFDKASGQYEDNIVVYAHLS
jgi:sortase (surface protein transpeptidase)